MKNYTHPLTVHHHHVASPYTGAVSTLDANELGLVQSAWPPTAQLIGLFIYLGILSNPKHMVSKTLEICMVHKLNVNARPCCLQLTFGQYSKTLKI